MQSHGYLNCLMTQRTLTLWEFLEAIGCNQCGCLSAFCPCSWLKSYLWHCLIYSHCAAVSLLLAFPLNSAVFYNLSWGCSACALEVQFGVLLTMQQLRAGPACSHCALLLQPKLAGPLNKKLCTQAHATCQSNSFVPRVQKQLAEKLGNLYTYMIMKKRTSNH